VSAIDATATAFERVAAQLQQRAKAAGAAMAAARQHAMTRDRIWRSAAALWPLFTKG